VAYNIPCNIHKQVWVQLDFYRASILLSLSMFVARGIMHPLEVGRWVLSEVLGLSLFIVLISSSSSHDNTWHLNHVCGKPH
jgi:hypothetical protein